jgi:hypothetical protein
MKEWRPVITLILAYVLVGVLTGLALSIRIALFGE